MLIGWDAGSSCRPGRVRAAVPRTGAGIPMRLRRAARRLAGRVVMAVAAASCAGVVAGLGSAAPAAGSVSAVDGPAAVPGAQLWASSGPAGDPGATSVAAPAGGTVFVTGLSPGSGDLDYATVAYDAATGAQLWVSRYVNINGLGGRPPGASVAVSPDGGTVVIAGGIFSNASGWGYLTVAYDAATGAQRWARQYYGRSSGTDQAAAIAVSPDGRTVLVTGKSWGGRSAYDYATVGYDAATGAQRWVSRYNAPGNGKDVARALAVSPDGRTVYVTGKSTGRTSNLDYATVAYKTATGAQRWVSRYNDPGNGSDDARSVAAGPGGHAIYVTGTTATVSYNAATGAQRWVRPTGPGHGISRTAYAVAASPDGRAVYVTGDGFNSGYNTVAYDAATGARLWARTYGGQPPGFAEVGLSVAADPGGHAVYVTGLTIGGYATVAYDAATGAQLWAAQSSNGGEAASLAVGPAGDVYVTGWSEPLPATFDYYTVAYQG